VGERSLVTAHTMSADSRVTDLIQTGQIRLALFLPQYAKDSGGPGLRGIGIGFVAIELGRELAARLGVDLRVIEHPTPPKAIESVKSGACDLAMLGIEPSRLGDLAFSPAVVQFDYTILAPAASALRDCGHMDRPGLRIAVVRNHASTLALTRIVRQATLIGFDVPDAAFDELRSGKADAFAAPREVLLDYAALLPGSQVLADSYGVNNVGIAVRKGQTERLAYIAEFAEDAKASGLIQRIIARGGLHGFRVAPAGNGPS
jgi:polar amino acid transport system substrate-binding protein